MTSKQPMTFRQFCVRTGEQLIAYVGENWRDRPLAAGFIDEAASHLSELDEYQLVYAIELCAWHEPDRFITLIAPFLADNRVAVWTSVTRAIDRMPSLSRNDYSTVALHASRSAYDLSEWIEELAKRVR